MVRSIPCSCRGPGLESQHLHDDSQPTVTPAARSLKPSFDLCGTRYAHATHAYLQAKDHAYQVNKSKRKFKKKIKPVNIG